MPGTPFEKELSVAIKAATIASQLTEEIRLTEFSSIEKDDNTPVTIADFSSQSVICSMLHDAFPEDPVVAEEDSTELRSESMRDYREKIFSYVKSCTSIKTEDELFASIDLGNADTAARFWTVDPIDGTKGYIKKGHYSIAIALVIDGKVTVSALACPTLKDSPTYGAIRGNGIVFAENYEDTWSPYKRIYSELSNRYVQSRERMSSNHSYHKDIAVKLELDEQPLFMDSQVKYIALLKNNASIYLRIPIQKQSSYQEKIWDHAAGALILSEAGGIVTDKFGNALDFSKKIFFAGGGIVATIDRPHDYVIDQIKEVCKLS